jgi:hypothetical protein
MDDKQMKNEEKNVKRIKVPQRQQTLKGRQESNKYI